MTIRLHDRALLREMRTPLLVSFIACLMMMVVEELYAVMDLLTAHRFPLKTLGLYLLYKLPMMAQQAIPVALLLGASLALSRFVHQNELTPIRLGGLPLPRILAPIGVVGLVLSVVCLTLSEGITPRTDHRAEALYRQLTFQSAIAGIQPDTFFRSGNRIFYFHTAFLIGQNVTALQGVLVYQLGALPGTPEKTRVRKPSFFWTADRADIQGETWLLRSAVRHEVAPDGEIVSDTPVGDTSINLHRSIEFFLNNNVKPQELTAAELAVRIREDERMSVPDSVILPLRYEYSFRYALPFACLVFALVSAPLTVRFARGGSLIGILVAFGVLFFYYDIMVIAERLALAGAFPPGVAAWLPNFLFGATGLILSAQEP